MRYAKYAGFGGVELRIGIIPKDLHDQFVDIFVESVGRGDAERG